MAWAAILLVIVFAFVLMPVHEQFVDAQGRYTDVSPNAPARPSWMSAPTTGSLVSASGVSPVDTSTAYSRTAPPITRMGAPASNMPASTTTYQEFMDAKKKFFNTLALNEGDYQLKFYFMDEKFEFPPSMASNPISASQVSEYKLYTSSYKSVQDIAAAINQPKPAGGIGSVDVFLRSAAGTLFPATTSGVLGAPTSNMGSAPVRGGGSSSSTCWGDPVDGDSGNFVSGEAYGNYTSKTMAAVMACYGGSFPPPGTQPTSAQMECIKKSSASYSTLDEAKAACSADASCKAVLSQLRGPGGTVYSKFNEDATIGPTAMRNPGMKIYVKKPCAGSPPASNLTLLQSPTASAPRITSTLGVGDPSLSGMNAAYTSGIIPPSGSPWEGLRGLTQMASEVTDPAFQAQTRPNPPLGTLQPVEPDMGLFGPGPNVLRKNLVSCTCASQAAGCSVHPRQ
jgi:hypothetical protein